MTTFKTSDFSFIGRNLACKQDKGLHLDAAKLEELISNKKLLPWIELNICALDFWDNDARRIMDEEFASMANCYDFSINNDGMAMLIAYCFAFIDNLPSRTMADL